MNATAKNIMIGIFVVIAAAIIIFILLFLHPTVGDNGKTLRVRFTDIDKVTIGTRVNYAGKPVGEVVDIQEIPEARTERLDHNGNVYVYELTLKVDSGVNVYNTDEITIRTSGLLGERNIAITPQPAKPDETLYLINNETIYARAAPTVEETLRQFGNLSQKFDYFLNDVQDVVNEIKQQNIIGKFAKTAQNIADISDALNQPEKWRQSLDNVWTLTERAKHSWTTVDKAIEDIYSLTGRAHGTLNTIDRAFTTLDRSFQSFDRLTGRAHHSWATIDQSLHNFYLLSEKANRSWSTIDNTLKEFHTASVNTNQFTDQIKRIIQNTSCGQGTIGRLFVGEDLYLRLKSILHKGQTIADDISHFGVLFHLNKDWQRLNARRLKLLQRLSTPAQFATYFNREFDDISSSLSRVSMILSDTECYPQSLLHNATFTEQFADLLKKVEDVEDSLKMYNEQVIDQECQCQSPF